MDNKLILIALISLTSKCVVAHDIFTHDILTGAEQTEKYLPQLKNKRVALLVNHTATIQDEHLVNALINRGIQIVKIFSPEHGFRGQESDGEWQKNGIDPATKLPIISLYNKQKKPTAADLEDVDVLVFDIQDVGARFYTYLTSLDYFMEAAAEHDKLLIILDRPNPNGFYIDGPVLDKKFASFVGKQNIPIVHGMTVGEYAQMLNGEHWIAKPCRLYIVCCQNYTHKKLYKLPIKPSPNLPTMTSIYLYPSLCLFEGTCISVGRGTEKPFEIFGHPDLPSNLYSFTPISRPGAHKPPLLNTICYGFNISESPDKILQRIEGRLQLGWLMKAYRLFPQKKIFFTSFFKNLAGNTQLQQQLETNSSEAEIRASWEPELSNFKKIRKKYLLYEDFE